MTAPNPLTTTYTRGFVIRLMKESDIEKAVEYGRMLQEESVFRRLSYEPEKMRALFKNCIEAKDKLALVAEDETGLIGGFLAAMYQHFYSNEYMASDLTFYIKPTKRGSLAAKRIARRYVEWAQEMGAKIINLSTSTQINAERTAKFYGTLGFVTTGYITTYGGST